MKRCLTMMILALWMSTALSLAADPLPRVKLTTSQGDIVVELDSAAAPKTVALTLY